MDRYAQQSLMDFLQGLLPGIGDQVMILRPQKKIDENAQALYDIWKNVENKVANQKLSRPPNVNEKTVKKLEAAGLISIHGKDMKVTANGVQAIKELILETEESAFEKSASNNAMVKTASRKEKLSGWYGRIRDQW